MIGEGLGGIMGTELLDHLFMGLISLPVGSKFIEGPCSYKKLFLGDGFLMKTKVEGN